ncbi:MAG: histidine--tRNA ligase [Gammaproteobacteria bacterium]
MSQHLQAIRGMNDILPADSDDWRALENVLVAILDAYGYREIRLPIVEQSAVFRRSIGDTTDIVQKEMYSFDDRNGDNLTLRPEGTAGCVRAVLQHGLLQQQPLRLWYAGPMFRHERPQRGRQRQFHQVGAEVFGAPGPDVDAELILMTARMWRALGLDGLRLEINSLGSADARAAYREVLTGYLEQHRDALDEDSLARLERNPLRILDSKNPAMAEVIAAAPSLADHLDDESRTQFDALQAILADNGIACVVNPRLVRGLDYYSRTVFEWITTELGAQGTVCAGGRYDGLVELMGGKSTPAVGFAMGLERLLELRRQALGTQAAAAPDIYLMATADTLDHHAMTLAERLRDTCPDWKVLLHVAGGSMKSRMKKADRSGARVALILGEDELAEGRVTLKPLREDAAQETCARDALAEVLARRLGD